MKREAIEIERAAARERHLEALIEEEQGLDVPVARILTRAARVGVQKPARAQRWLAAALVVLGVGVAVAVAAFGRRTGGPQAPIEAQDPQRPRPIAPWIPEPREIPRPSSLSDEDAAAITSLGISAPLYSVGSFEAYTAVEHLLVGLSPAAMANVIRWHNWGKDGERLRSLAGIPTLRTLTLDGQPLGVDDVAALADVPSLEALWIRTLTTPRDDQARWRTYDPGLTAAIAAHCAARSLMLANATVEPGALRALEPMELQELSLGGDFAETTSETLMEIAGLRALEHLELRLMHAAAIEGSVRVDRRVLGSKVLTPEFFEALGQLPRLRSLVLDQCALDDALVRALPRGLERLDLSTCSGMRGEVLGEVLGEMARLRELGLPLPLDDAPGDRDAFRHRPPTREGEDVHQPTTEEVCTWIDDRPWRALRLRGAIQPPLVKVLGRQSALVDLELTPAQSSVPLGFVAQLPQLRRVTLADTLVTDSMLEGLGSSTSLVGIDLGDSGLHPDARDAHAQILERIPIRAWIRR